MKAILLARGGFKKEMELGDFKPEIDIAIPPIVSYTEEPTSAITFDRRTFYFERDFFNEDNARVLIYVER